MRKEITFLSKLDTSDFDRSIENMQRRLKEAYRPGEVAISQTQTSQKLEAAGLPGFSKQTQDAFKRSMDQHRAAFDKAISDEAKNLEKTSKLIESRIKTLERLKKLQGELVKGSEEEQKVKETISRVEENQFKMRESYKQREDILNQALDERSKLKRDPFTQPPKKGIFGSFVEQYEQGGFGGMARRGLENIGPFGRMAGMAGAGLTAIGAGMQQGAEFYRDLSRTPIRTELSSGAAVQGAMGKQVQDIYGRRTAFENVWAPERARSAQMALEASKAQQTADKWSLGGAFTKSLGMGAAGMATGAAVGSLIPGVGTLIGGAVGGLAGLGKGAYNILSDERQRSLALSPFSKDQDKRYQSIIAEQMTKDYQDTYEAQKQQNPYKQAASQEYEQNYMRNLQAQRSMGLTNEQFYGKGGFLQKGTSAGFTPEMSLQMSQDILGAGGSTRMARESAFGSQLQRGTDLTNAGQVLGTLSGGLGSSEATKQATIKILAEGTKLGLDDSKFAAENRVFTQTVADIVSKSGAKSSEDFQRISGGFGKFVGENTMQGMEAAKTAYEQYQQISSTTTGARGVMRAAGFMSDKNLSKLSTMTKQALMQVPEADLNENNPLVQQAADEASKGGKPVSAKEIVNSITGVNQNSVSRFAEADQVRDRLKSRMKEINKTTINEQDLSSLPEDMQRDFRQLATYQAAEHGWKSQRAAVDFALGTVNEPGKETPEEQKRRSDEQLARETKVSAKIAGEGPGRMEDTTIKAMAADSKVVLDNFNEMAPSMKKAAESSAALTKELRELGAELNRALENARTGKSQQTQSKIEDILQKMSEMGTKNQTQTGKVSK